jgi:hypothetical protein
VSEVFAPDEAARRLGLDERELRRLAFEHDGQLPSVKRLRDNSLVGISPENIAVWRDFLDKRRAAERRRAEELQRQLARAKHEDRERGLA